MLLPNMTIVVTGAASDRGVGRATCRLAQAEGARIIAADRDGDGLARLQDELGDAIITAKCDLTRSEDCEDLAQIAAAQDASGLVHCAGRAEPMGLKDLDRASYERMLDVNLWGTLQIVQALAPAMTKRGAGSIVCLSSLAGQRGGGYVGGLHYSASKAAVLGAVRSLARELGPQNIRVNAVAPGLVDTDMTAPFMSREQRAELAKQAPLGRMASADEVAGVCLFLVSRFSTYVTGATIDVNGGLHIH
jgi:NAD(P)-dependent dehydrogenase (short-subunit alcohol dehydrogenase family)